MNVLSSIITYVRRIIKLPSNTQITDNLIIDYINRFWIMDVDARIQLFDLKTKYQFVTVPGRDRYNMPLYELQTEPGDQVISYYPVYQGFTGPAFVNGIQMGFHTLASEFDNIWPSYQQQTIQAAIGNGSKGPYTLNLPYQPNSPTQFPPFQGSSIIPGHIDMLGVIAYANANGGYQDPPLAPNDGTTIPTVPVTSVMSSVFFSSTASDGSNVVIQDSGQFLQSNLNYGLLMEKGNAPLGNLPLTNDPTPNYSTTQNTINYLTGIATNVYFPVVIPEGMPITAQCIYYQTGIPRSMLYYNNCITLRSPPSTQYVVELEAYLTPAAFFNSTQSIPFAYMSEYIARGAARKILSDTGDTEQFNFYEGLFREQETLVWKRSQRQFTSTRTQTLYSMGNGMNGGNNYGQGTY